jgi:hypothetical protein
MLNSVEITQADRNALADEWAMWISQGDGEVQKLKAGGNGAIGSPRWVALQAIARTRLAK